MIEDVIQEWWTGYDTKGVESRLAGWSTTAGMRSRVVSIDQLGAMLARSDKNLTHVRVKLVEGVDGRLDVRIETQSKSGTLVQRWRPTIGDLGNVLEFGTTRNISGIAAKHTLALSAALALDESKASLEQIIEAISALKTERNHLAERTEVGYQTSSADKAVTTKLADVRTRHSDLVAAAKLAKAVK